MRRRGPREELNVVGREIKGASEKSGPCVKLLALTVQ